MLLCVHLGKMLEFRKKKSLTKTGKKIELKYSIREIFEAPLQLLLNIPPHINIQTLLCFYHTLYSRQFSVVYVFYPVSDMKYFFFMCLIPNSARFQSDYLNSIL